MQIQLHAIRDGVTKLGPGNRFVIWTQGCPHRCPGCMTPESWNTEGGFCMDTRELAEQILKSGKKELTISGGEPFMQARALSELIHQVRKKTDLGVIVYTGYTIEELQETDKPDGRDYRECMEQCDLLIDGRYMETLNDSKNLRGSSNQRAIALTSRYQKFAKEIGTRPAEAEIFYDEDTIRLVGVPPRELLANIKQKAFTENSDIQKGYI